MLCVVSRVTASFATQRPLGAGKIEINARVRGGGVNDEGWPFKIWKRVLAV